MLPSVYIVLFAATTLASIVLFFIRRFTYWQRKNVPFITPIIPFGNALDLLLGKITLGELFSNAYLEFQRRGCKHGGIFILWRHFYIPVDPDIIKRIAVTDFENFTNRGLYYSEKQPLSQHLFNIEDKRWKVLRTKFPSAFTTTKLRSMFLIMNKYCKGLQNLLEEFAEEARPVEIKSELSRFTVDTISASLFGMESKTMEKQNEELIEHGRTFFDYQFYLFNTAAMLLVPRKILEFINFRLFPKKTAKYIMDLFKGIKDYREKSGDRRKDFTRAILDLTDANISGKDFTGKHEIQPMTVEEFCAQMYVFFSAGFETSSSTQTFAIYELAKNPEYQKALREEINSVLSKHNGVTYDAVMEMKYLNNIIEETLRLYPVLPILPRVCKNDYQIPGTDIILEKDTFVIITNMGLQRDPDYYPDPDRFDPDRFLSKNKRSRPFVSYMPFGEGPRVCIGKRFGLLQSKLGLIHLFRDYEVSLSEKTTDSFKFVSRELILRKEGDIWVNLKKIT